MAIEVGSRVWWEDPDTDDSCSYEGTVTAIHGDEDYVIYNISEGTEAFLSELTEL